MIVYKDITVLRFVVEDDLGGPNSQCLRGDFILHKYEYFVCFTLLSHLSILHARNKQN